MKCCFCCCCCCCCCCCYCFCWSQKTTCKVWLKLGREQLRYFWLWVPGVGGGVKSFSCQTQLRLNFVGLGLGWGFDNIRKKEMENNYFVNSLGWDIYIINNGVPENGYCNKFYFFYLKKFEWTWIEPYVSCWENLWHFRVRG